MLHRANPADGRAVPLRAASGFRWRQRTMRRRASPHAGDGRVVTGTPPADRALIFSGTSASWSVTHGLADGPRRHHYLDIDDLDDGDIEDEILARERVIGIQRHLVLIETGDGNGHLLTVRAGSLQSRSDRYTFGND